MEVPIEHVVIVSVILRGETPVESWRVGRDERTPRDPFRGCLDDWCPAQFVALEIFFAASRATQRIRHRKFWDMI